MNSTLVPVLVALIAAAAGLTGGYLTGRYQSNLEQMKWERTRREEYQKETRLAVAELARKLGAAVNAMEWVTWTAEHSPAGLPEQEVHDYNDRMHQLWPEITGAHFVVAAYNTQLHARMTPLVDMVTDLDSKIAKAFAQNTAAAHFDAARKTHAELGNQVAEILAASFQPADRA